MYARKPSSCCGCDCELWLACGTDYLAVDARAIVFGDDGTWPEGIESVRLVFESVDGCGCNATCSLEVSGKLYEAGCVPHWPTSGNATPLKGCDGSGAGFMFVPGACADPAATVSLDLCDGTPVGLLYPTPVPGKATVPVRVGCDASAQIVGYALNSLASGSYRSAGCTTNPGQQRTAWFDVTGGQTRRIGGFAGRYKVFGTLVSGSTVLLAEGPVL